MKGQKANSQVDYLHLSSVAAVEFDWVSIGNGTVGKTGSKKTESFLLSGSVHENYRRNKIIVEIK